MYLNWETDSPSPVNMLFLGSLKLSRIFLSSVSAIISAALPLGQRITGIVPRERERERERESEREE